MRKWLYFVGRRLDSTAPRDSIPDRSTLHRYSSTETGILGVHSEVLSQERCSLNLRWTYWTYSPHSSTPVPHVFPESFCQHYRCRPRPRRMGRSLANLGRVRDHLDSPRRALEADVLDCPRSSPSELHPSPTPSERRACNCCYKRRGCCDRKKDRPRLEESYSNRLNCPGAAWKYHALEMGRESVVHCLHPSPQ